MKALLIALVIALLMGCSTIQEMMPSHREAEKRAQDMRDLNLRVMRYADEYAGRVKEAMGEFQNTARGPEERLAAQNWKSQQVESAFTIASGPNPVSNALDMVVLATLSRAVLDDAWTQRTYGERARPVLETHRTLEEGAWRLTNGVLTDSQMAQLRQLITRWRDQNPSVSAVAYIHFTEFAKSIGSPRPGETATPGNLFSLLGLDPLTQLDPAIREVTQTRELAERAMFYMQRAPEVLDLRVQRVVYQLAVAPETKSILTDLDRASLVGSAANDLAASLPDLLAREREALVRQLVQELNDRQESIGSLSRELRSTLQAGTDTANALHATLETFDRIAARFPQKPGAASSPEKSEQFDITEYTEMLRELTAAVRELEALSQNAGAALPAMRGALDTAGDRFERTTDRVFTQLLVLVVVAIVVTWAGAIAYRVVVLRMQRER